MSGSFDDQDAAFAQSHIAWLKTVAPEDWHRVALDFNFGESLEPLLWIVQQPNCDRATALTIFWKAEPAYFLEERSKDPDEEPDFNRDLVFCIAERLNARSYKRCRIAWRADSYIRQDYDEMVASAKVLRYPSFRPSKAMIRSLLGRWVRNDRSFYKRYPEDFHGTVAMDVPPLSSNAAALLSRVKAIMGELR